MTAKLQIEKLRKQRADDATKSMTPEDNQEVAALQSSEPTVEQSSVSKTGSLMTNGGMATANPYVMGAGMALQTIGSVDQANRQEFANNQARKMKALDAYTRAINMMG